MSLLRDKRVLLIEDEVIVALLTADYLDELGAITVGPAHTLEDGLILAREATLDVALIDVNLGGELSWPIADILKQRNVPIAFATGYGTFSRDGQRCKHVLDKPYTKQQLARVLHRALSDGA